MFIFHYYEKGSNYENEKLKLSLFLFPYQMMLLIVVGLWIVDFFIAKKIDFTFPPLFVVYRNVVELFFRAVGSVGLDILSRSLLRSFHLFRIFVRREKRAETSDLCLVSQFSRLYGSVVFQGLNFVLVDGFVVGISFQILFVVVHL